MRGAALRDWSESMRCARAGGAGPGHATAWFHPVDAEGRVAPMAGFDTGRHGVGNLRTVAVALEAAAAQSEAERGNRWMACPGNFDGSWRAGTGRICSALRRRHRDSAFRVRHRREFRPSENSRRCSGGSSGLHGRHVAAVRGGSGGGGAESPVDRQGAPTAAALTVGGEGRVRARIHGTRRASDNPTASLGGGGWGQTPSWRGIWRRYSRNSCCANSFRYSRQLTQVCPPAVCL